MHLWILNEEIASQLDSSESITKISNVNNKIFALTINNNLFCGSINISDNKKTIDFKIVDNLKLLDISSCNEHLFIITLDGSMFKCDENLEILSEICLYDEFKCVKGHSSPKYKLKAKNVSSGEYGQLFLTDEGQIWGSGHMPQIGITSETPQKVQFFSGRTVHSIGVGNDFAIAIVNKQNKSESSDSDPEEIATQNCPKCVSASQLASPNSLNSNSDICPLGIPVKGSYDIETTSTSSKNSSPCESEKIETNDDKQEEKNIIFRNTEAAKEFLTRQISRMSSASEEYLEPTRIIKENVSNVATLMYESVKTVSGKVATLSRHVSLGSDCNGTVEMNGIKRISSKDEFELSLSQCTSERDLSEHGLEEKANIIVNLGSDLLSREVWTWGNIMHGQLGVGDKIKRERPMIISKLSNIGVAKVSVQSCHVSVLTIDGRGYIWGQNDYNQVTSENNVDISSPKLFITKSNERILDIVCGNNCTLVYCSNNNIILYFGKGSNVVEALNIEQSDENDFKKTVPFKNLISSDQYSLINNVLSLDSDIQDFLVQEQKNLEEMLLVHQHLIKPLHKKGSYSPVAFEDICKHYKDLLYFWTANIQSLIEFCNGIVSDKEIIVFKYFEEHIFVYNNYVSSLQNIISIDAFKNISNLIQISSVLSKAYQDIFSKKEKDVHIISYFLSSPLNKIDRFTPLISKYCTNKDNVTKWNTFVEKHNLKQKEAERTKEFWQTIGKSVDFLKHLDRRLIQDSQKNPISLQNAGRFSSHWFILFSDLFIHVNGSSSHIYNLTTIWIEPQQDENTQQYQIILKTPEDTLTLFTLEPESKIQWFHTLQHAIKVALNKADALQPPLLRSGTYTFIKPGFFKDAKYTGRWLNAKMHGTGKLEWPDGKTYVGHFVNNQMCGYGTMEIPLIGRYEGDWKDNQQNGLGTFIYSNTDLYKGHFKDGIPNGHGCLRKGNFMANSASLYIGDWNCGLKNGYGVMDDISTGEKYMGYWSDDKRHGNGLIVTSEGTYYEGTFVQDVLTGHGVMILDDGTHYEGEFKGTGNLNGKGTLTLSNGQKIEGNLMGNFREGIKINGTFMKNSQNATALPKSFGELCTPADKKWKSLFKYCQQVLGISDMENVNKETKSADSQKIWQNVAVYLSNATTLKRNKRENRLENSLNQLDTIPPFGRDKIDLKSYDDIKSYLLKAFESNIHPLGILLNNISEAYTMAYSGKVHPLLLPHAINELIDITKRIYEIVTFLFPALPVYGKHTFLCNGQSDEVVSYQSLLYPILLPKVHNPLFILLSLKNEKAEKHYKKTLTEWNKQSDVNLMNFLSVDSKFCEKPQESMFVEAIETLQQIKSMFSPTEKLLVIKYTIEKMTNVAQSLLGQNYIWNMDDLFPLFLYVVVRARIPELGSELEFVDKFMDPNLENGELGIMFTTLKACYQQILQEKSSF